MKSIKIILCICFGILISNTTIMASTSQTNTIVETFSDVSYIESSISFPSTSKALSSSSTKTASKTSTYKNNSGKTLWSVTVTGSFTYNGSTSKCIRSTVSTTCPDRNWKIIKSFANKTDSTASATVSTAQYLNGIHMRTINRTIKLTCSKTGKLS